MRYQYQINIDFSANSKGLLTVAAGQGFFSQKYTVLMKLYTAPEINMYFNLIVLQVGLQKKNDYSPSNISEILLILEDSEDEHQQG